MTSLLDLRLHSAARRAVRSAAATGGLLGLALLPLAVAHADEWTVTADPDSTETITGIYGHGFDGGDTAPPAVPGVQGEQVFDYSDTTTGDSGSFSGLESASNDGLGDTNTEVYVDGDTTGAGAPSVGSVFDTYSYDYGAFTNVYSDVDGTITDTLESPTGDIAVPTTFDASGGQVVYADQIPVGDGDVMQGVGAQHVLSVSGIPPVTVALEGTQNFNFDNSLGDLVGTVGAVDTTTTDALGTYTEAVLVTNDDGLTNVGTTAADVPAVGSIFNTIDFDGIDNVYSDLVAAGGNTYTDTLVTPLGDVVMPTTFDAAQAETLSDSPVTFPAGLTLTPTDDLNFTSVDGLPPLDVSVQGGQDFDFADGSSTGTFTADVTNTMEELNDSTETVLVTSSSDPSVLPAGSEFEIVNFGYGFESLYSDIASATSGGDAISETMVTPLGDISMPASFDAAAGLINDMFDIIHGM